MRTRGTLSAVVIVCCGLAASAQQAPQTPKPSFRSGVELVTFDVGVTDRQGQPVRNLTAADFTVTVAGVARRVVSAEFIDTASAGARGASRPDIVPVSSNDGGGIGRLFVFVVDQTTLDPGHLRNAANAASRLLSKLTFADRSAMMVLPVGPNVGFTWAHDRVGDALQRVTGTARASMQWESGTLAEAREIANRNTYTLRSVSERECGTSSATAAAAGGGIGGGGPTGVASPTPAPSGGGAAGGPGGAAGGGTASPGGSGTTSVPRAPAGGGISSNACVRELQMNAEMSWRTAQMTAQSSVMALRELISKLARVPGDKTIILISGGWPLDERDETTSMELVAAEAAAAHATINSVYVPASTSSAERRMMSIAPMRDQFLQWGPLDTLAAMTGGGSVRAEVGAEIAFDRLARELSGYYRLGVERDPEDANAKARRMKVDVKGSATVRARTIFDARTYEDRDWSARLASALESPVPSGGVGLRVTSYIAADPADMSHVKLVLTGEVSRIQPGDTVVQILVRDMDGKKVLGADAPVAQATGDVLPFATTLPIAPGTYLVRIAAMDSAGRVGSVEHRVDARPVPIGPLTATGPLLVRVPGRPPAESRLAVGEVAQKEMLAVEIDLMGESARLSTADVTFEVPATADGPALVHTAGSIGLDAHDGALIAQGVADVRLLPPGEYVARARVTSGNETFGELRRVFTLVGVEPAVTDDGGTVVTRTAEPSLAVARTARSVGAATPFTLEQVLAPEVVGEFLERAGTRSESDGPMPFFRKGIALLEKHQLDPALHAFHDAIRASADFYPAMVYIGACYAASGQDKLATNTWRTALIKESEAASLHRLLIDALLRQGRGDMALETVNGARERWPDDAAFKRQFVIAALTGGKPADGVKALDEIMASRKVDEPVLALAMLTIYDASQSGRPIESAEQDRARMTRLAELYRTQGGSSIALVDTWVAAMNKQK